MSEEIITGMCVECGDQPIQLSCVECGDDMCEVCFEAQHRKGKRALHKGLKVAVSTTQGVTSNESKVNDGDHVAIPESIPNVDATSEVSEGLETKDTQTDNDNEVMKSSSSSASKQPILSEKELLAGPVLKWYGEKIPSAREFQRSSHFVPLRMTELERQYLSIVEGTLEVSEYTDKVDIVSYRSKSGIIDAQIKDICSLLSGLIVCAEYKLGSKLVKNKTFRQNEEWFQRVLEVGRRHKVRNPEKMRDIYGKLIYMLMDSQQEGVPARLGLDLMAPMKTVHDYLKVRGGTSLLYDPVFAVATAQINPQQSREVITQCSKQKAQALRYLINKYTGDGKSSQQPGPFKKAKLDDSDDAVQVENGDESDPAPSPPPTLLSEEDVRMSVNSFNDAHSFLQDNRVPIDTMINYLLSKFPKDSPDSEHSLEISHGRGGSCLSHNHRTQRVFVYQSLRLWRRITHNMFELWTLAETDLTDPGSYYRLRNTGQGMQRMQSCPRVGRKMRELVTATQQEVKGWIGLSVVHLADRDVPNALVFIDKYNQVARILNPIVLVLTELEKPSLSKELKSYVNDTFGSVDKCIVAILRDFFRHGFDGSGSDGGSCIDGRLTSAWNWCSKLAKKPYYPVFLLCGFIGFDGDF